MLLLAPRRSLLLTRQPRLLLASLGSRKRLLSGGASQRHVSWSFKAKRPLLRSLGLASASLVAIGLVRSRVVFAENRSHHGSKEKNYESIPADSEELERILPYEENAEEELILRDDDAGDVVRWSMLLRLMRQDWIYYFCAAAASVMSSLAAAAQGRVIGVLFDVMGDSKGFESLVRPLEQLLALMVAAAGFSFVSSFALAVATTELGRKLRLEYYKAILNKDIEKFDEMRVGEITHQLSQDIAALQTAVRTAFSRGVEGVTSIISGSYFLYIASPKLAMAMFGILPITSGAAHVLGVMLRNLSERIRVASNRATGIANETFGAIHTVRAFGGEKREIERYNEELVKVSELKRSMALMAGSFYSMLHLGINLITLLICGYGGQLVTTGELTRGGIASIVAQVQILERSMSRLSVTSAQLFKAFRSSQHIFDAIQEKPRVNTSEGGLGLVMDQKRIQGEVLFENVDFRYPTRPEVQVLNHFNLLVNSGKVVALVGHSGSGKSTVASLLKRFYDVDAGRVTIDGIDLRDMDPKSLHEIVGIVSQEPVLFGTTVKDNILYAKPDAKMNEIIRAAKSANAHDFIERLPQGYDTQLGERGVLLSGGQRQRIAIARAILRDPAILILDEATSSLDRTSESIVQAALDDLLHAKARTTFIIAHRLSTVKNADIIVVLDRGSIVEMGSHQELLKKGGAYAKLYSSQAKSR